MKNVTIVSHLTPEEWKQSWRGRVVLDTKENMRAYQRTTCFWGHFKNETDFTICHHEEFEIKGMSMGLYFNGHLEEDPRGCIVTGTFGKKLSANLFLGVGAVLCILAIVGSLGKEQPEVTFTAGVLFVILLLFYLIKPKRGQERLLNELKTISFKTGKKKK